jgi:hypothetical protein
MANARLTNPSTTRCQHYASGVPVSLIPSHTRLISTSEVCVMDVGGVKLLQRAALKSGAYNCYETLRCRRTAIVLQTWPCSMHGKMIQIRSANFSGATAQHKAARTRRAASQADPVKLQRDFVSASRCSVHEFVQPRRGAKKCSRTSRSNVSPLASSGGGASVTRRNTASASASSGA